MDIYDIIIEPPPSEAFALFDDNLISIIIFSVTALIAILTTLYYRKYIAICTLHYISMLLKQKKITYKGFAFLLARILCFRHKTNTISKKDPPFKSSKKKHFLWIALIDTLNDVRYSKTKVSVNSQLKLQKTALEWLRHS
ncbi:MAG: hypothetical protein ACC653_06105 [Gammaproteobacteria bacterium]